MLVLNNGNCIGRYKYPRVEIPFSSPMLNWRNIAFCGGFHVSNQDGKGLNDDDLVKAVITGKKPIGFVQYTKEVVEKLAKMAEQNGCAYYIQPEENPHRPGKFEIGIANKGTLTENFDIEALIESYRILSQAQYPGFKFLKEKDEDALGELTKKKLSDFLMDMIMLTQNRTLTLSLLA